MTQSQQKVMPCDCSYCGSRPPCPALDELPRFKMPTHDDWAEHGTDWYISRLQWRLAQAEMLLNTRPTSPAAEPVVHVPGPGMVFGIVSEAERVGEVKRWSPINSGHEEDANKSFEDPEGPYVLQPATPSWKRRGQGLRQCR